MAGQVAIGIYSSPAEGTGRCGNSESQRLPKQRPAVAAWMVEVVRVVALAYGWVVAEQSPSSMG